MSRGLIALVAACLAAGAWIAISGGDDANTPPPGDRVLAEGEDWTLVVTARPALELRRPNTVSAAHGYSRPITLNEMSSYKAPREDGDVTLVAGPVRDGAVEVTIGTVGGLTAEAEVFSVHDLSWFFAELDGVVRVSEITARDEEGIVVDEFTLPPAPPDPANPILTRSQVARPYKVVGSDGEWIICPDGDPLLVRINDDPPPPPGVGKLAKPKTKADRSAAAEVGGVPRCGPGGGGRDGIPIWVPISVGKNRTVAPQRYIRQQTR